MVVVSKKNKKKSRVNEYYLPVLVFILGAIIFLISSNTINSSFIKEEDKVVEKNISIQSVIEEDNKDNELIKREKYDDIVYYLYKENDKYKSYFINRETNEITDVYSLIKSDKIGDFNEKINYLLNLKYPRFVVDAINECDNKNYLIDDNEMIIYYDNVNLELEDYNLYLTINFNEIKDYLNIIAKLDSEYTNEDGYNYDPNKKTIAFSYDDGPAGSLTLDLVNILAENKAHATFFMVGNRMNNYETVVTTVHNSGNEIGSHTYSHYNLKTTKINKILEKEALTSSIYYDITKDTLTLLRPPYGSINSSVKDTLDNVFITWSVDTEDWRYKDVEYIKNMILDNVSDGDIVLMHDLYETTVEATREVLPILYTRGYQVVSVSELANLKGRTLEKNTIYRRISSE